MTVTASPIVMPTMTSWARYMIRLKRLVVVPSTGSMTGIRIIVMKKTNTARTRRGMDSELKKGIREKMTEIRTKISTKLPKSVQAS